MSNLIKSVYFNNLTEGKNCVIDSDSRIEEFIPGIYAQPVEEAGEYQFRQLTDMGSDTGAEFTSGLNVINMEEVLDEERQKLSEETAAQSEELISAARAQADEIIAEANAQAEDIKKDAYEEGRAQGIEEGQNYAMQALREQEEALKQEYNQKLLELREQEKELEPHFATIVAALVEKLTGAVCKSKKDVIVHLIDNALRNLEKSKRIVLRVSKADIAMVSSKRGAFLKELKEGTELEITEDNSLSANQCIIETDNKIVDCSLDAQLDSLREQIKMIAM
ncbi:MAG: hypothetical protein K1W15_12880 [Lachnospiraceae bacterium]